MEMLSRYQRCQFPALSPPSSSADRAGSNAKMILISERGAFLPQRRHRLGDQRR
jgi:hypothetical protein